MIIFHLVSPVCGNNCNQSVHYK